MIFGIALLFITWYDISVQYVFEIIYYVCVNIMQVASIGHFVELKNKNYEKPQYYQFINL